ncbi:uncharacterized protein LOC128680701 isoform X2 [Plodia interpunctella]|nr:uncharacterized protein LOC128680701 isoform X2 [Plodia interpunctella]
MIRFTNIAVRVLIGSQHTTYDTGYWPGLSSTLRLLTCVAVLLSLVCQCENVYRQNDNLLNVIDHLLINKKPSDLLRHDATQLRDLIKSRPIRFNMVNFLTLNNSLLLSLTSVVVTYTIIILQSVN